MMDGYKVIPIHHAQGDNYHQTETITSFVKDLNISPYFTNAVKEYREQMDITETWDIKKWE